MAADAGSRRLDAVRRGSAAGRVGLRRRRHPRPASPGADGVAGGVPGRRGRRRWLSSTLLIELGLVITAGVAATGLPVDGGSTRGYMVIGLLAAALGVQNATVRRLAVPDLTTTVLTLTLTGLAADFRLAWPGPQVGRRLAAVGADGRRRTIRPAPGGWWGAEAGGKQ